MTEKTFHIIQGPQSQTEPRMITPKQRLKFQIENQLDMTSLIAAGKPMRELVDRIFEAVFNSETVASVQDVLFEIRELEKSIESGA